MKILVNMYKSLHNKSNKLEKENHYIVVFNKDHNTKLTKYLHASHLVPVEIESHAGSYQPLLVPK